MANSLSHITNRVFSGETSSITQDPSPSAAGTGGSATGGGGGAGSSAPASSSTDQPKRKRGRPKGSVTKKPDDTATSSGPSGDAKVKRPVGRPRKDGLPAGSVPKRSPVKRQKIDPGGGEEPAHFAHGFAPWSAGAPLTGVGYPTPAHHPGHAPPPHHMHSIAYIPQDTKFVTDEWGELVHTNPHEFLATLLAALAAPNPTSATGPSVEEAFKTHLQSLAPNTATAPSVHNIPSLYSILKTFWLPSSPAYFTMAASASNTRVPMEYRFLYWDPQPLVFNGIQCPFCPCFLVNNGRIISGPIKVYDLGKPFFIIGCEYVCTSPQCTASTTPEGRKFSSTDASIMNSLPKGLKDEFPARLLYADTDAGSGLNIWNWNAMGVSTALWNLVMGGLSIGLRKEGALHLVRSVQYGAPEIIKCEMKEERSSTMPVNANVVAGDGGEEEFDTQEGASTTGTLAAPENATEPGNQQQQNGWSVDESSTQATRADTDSHSHTQHTHPHSSPSFRPTQVQPQGQGQPQPQPQPQPQTTTTDPSSLLPAGSTADTTTITPSHAQQNFPHARTTTARPQPPAQAQPQPQPQAPQPRQSPAFPHYTYSQYTYYPDQPPGSAAAAASASTGGQRNGGATTAGGNQLTR